MAWANIEKGFAAVFILTLGAPAAAQQGYVPSLTDRVRCVAIAELLATHEIVPAKAQNLASQAKTLEQVTGQWAVASGKSQALVTSSLNQQRQLMATQSKQNPKALTNNLGLCVTDKLLTQP